MRIALLLFDGVDLLDVGGPYEVFLTANRILVADGEPAPFDVRLVAPRPGRLSAYGGMVLEATATPGPSEVFIVPGTIDVDRAVADDELLDAVRAGAEATGLLASVCTGALLLAHADVLGGAPATTHHEDLEELAALIGDERTHAARWVDAGDVVTAGGLSSGLAMALHLVERLVSRDLAVRTAARLAYDWDPTDGVVADG